MEFFNCWFEKFGDFFVGLFALGIALMLTVIGMTVLPVVGLVLAVPVFFVAFKFISAPTGDACSLP